MQAHGRRVKLGTDPEQGPRGKAPPAYAASGAGFRREPPHNRTYPPSSISDQLSSSPLINPPRWLPNQRAIS